MKQGFRPTNSLLFFPILFSTFAFGIAFWFSYQEDRDQVAEMGQLARAHLNYAVQLGDDMALIDWAKNFEKSSQVLAFQVTVQSKRVAQGGNENFIPTKTAPGLSFRLPSDWIFRWDPITEGPHSAQLLFVYRPSQSPLTIAFVAFSFCFLALTTTARFSTRTPSLTAPSLFNSEESILPSPAPLPFPSLVLDEVEGSTFLFLDKNYVIQKVSLEAARLLGKEPAQLLQGHLFDLSPEPSLMRAIEKGEEARFPKPFSSYPNLSVSLKPSPKGTLLVLESFTRPEALKKL